MQNILLTLSVCDWKALSLWKQNSRIKDEWRTSDLVIFWWNIPAFNRYFLIGILICLQNGICDSWEDFFLTNYWREMSMHISILLNRSPKHGPWMSEQNINITQDLDYGRKGRDDNLWLRIKKQNKMHHIKSWIKDLLASGCAKVVNNSVICLPQIPQLLTSHLLGQYLYIYIYICIYICLFVYYQSFWVFLRAFCRNDEPLSWIS